METSFEVMFLVIVALAATGYAFYQDVRRSAENDRFLEWIKTERSAEWQALTRSDRFLTIRAVEILRRGSLAADAEFVARYHETRHGKRFLVAMGIAGGAIATLLIGTEALGWVW